ncbi:hypothetical protein K0M31_003446 [Melipona bicolor]|uniref:Uncharacterized protein n=1 Tax=Melipona bicolor TaxID=60889 RepID=A0AA40FZ19_9HYME|nr:hypothetical protein K0M31_003446 [Melipona bicolor]
MYTTTVTRYEEKKEADRTLEKDVEPLPVPRERTPASQPIIWQNVIGIIVLHFLAVYGFVSGYRDAKFWTWIWTIGYGVTTGFGITAGAHRLWAHKSYSAKIPLRIFLACLYCMAGQTRFYNWIRDHRTHHRYTETPADPHDATRGFFFSHIGWLMVKRHPAVKEYGSKVDMSDIASDPAILWPILVFTAAIQTYQQPCPGWIHEDPLPSLGSFREFMISRRGISLGILIKLRSVKAASRSSLMKGDDERECVCPREPEADSKISGSNGWLNGVSVAAGLPAKARNAAVCAFCCLVAGITRRVKPTENPTVSFFALGEGWHNYHHSFPWDYKAAELGAYGLNPTTAFIELMALVGLAYNLKTPSKELVDRTTMKKGDGTNSLWGNHRH